MPKRVVGSSTNEGQVHLIEALEREDEADAIVSHLLASTREQSQCAVLARTNLLLDTLEVKMAAANIPYQRSGGKSVWEREIPAVILSLLRALAQRRHAGLLFALHFAGIQTQVVELMLPNEGALSADPYDTLLKAMHNPPRQAGKLGSVDRERIIQPKNVSWTR